MFKMTFGFIAGVGMSVMHYDYGISPNELAGIIIKNGQDIVEEVQNSSDGEPDYSESIMNRKPIFLD